MFSCRKFLNVYSLRRPTLSTRTASPLALVLHHLILDVLTHLRRRTSPTHPYPTVTYGEWYVFHDPPPDVTIPKSNLQGIFCRVCRVHHSRHNYTGPPCCMAVSPKGSLTFSFFQSPTEQAPMQFQNFSNGHRFQTSLCFSLEWHTDPKTWSFFASYPNLINHWKNCHHSLTHAVPTRFVCHVLSTYPLHHVPLVAWSSPV